MNFWSTACPLIEPVKWNVYTPGWVGVSAASHSPWVPRPVSGSQDGSRPRYGLVWPPKMAWTLRLVGVPRSSMALPLASWMKIWTPFSAPA